jgi:purine-binding chemotaxis protein CheW
MPAIGRAESKTTKVDEVEQYLTFLLDSQEYGIPILEVQEIKGYSGVTPIPNAPPWIKGVMNLRGTVVPVCDLRVRFGMPEAAYTQFTVVILVMLGRKVCGLVVDAVSDVLSLLRSDIDFAPDLGGGSGESFVKGIAKNRARLVALLDVQSVCSFEARAPARPGA